MTIEEMKKKKQEKGYSYAMMSDLSGVQAVYRPGGCPVGL